VVRNLLLHWQFGQLAPCWLFSFSGDRLDCFVACAENEAAIEEASFLNLELILIPSGQLVNNHIYSSSLKSIEGLESASAFLAAGAVTIILWVQREAPLEARQ
jgi:hypothetical protein